MLTSGLNLGLRTNLSPPYHEDLIADWMLHQLNYRELIGELGNLLHVGSYVTSILESGMLKASCVEIE